MNRKRLGQHPVLIACTRFSEVLIALAIATAILVPALPTDWTGRLGIAIIDATRKISVGQRWGMYAPNPPNAVTYLALTGHYANGTAEPLEERVWAENAFGTHWAWTKRRTDIWRFYVSRGKPGRQNPHRNWYLKAVCVREDRKGEMPMRITGEFLTHQITPPDKVRTGAPDLSPLRRKYAQMVDCRFGPIRGMLKVDKQRRGDE